MENYNKSDLVSFGNYLLSKERKNLYSDMTKELISSGLNPLSTEERLQMVNDSDIENLLSKYNILENLIEEFRIWNRSWEIYYETNLEVSKKPLSRSNFIIELNEKYDIKLKNI